MTRLGAQLAPQVHALMAGAATIGNGNLSAVGGPVEMGGLQPIELVELAEVEEDRAEHRLLGGDQGLDLWLWGGRACP